MASVPLSTKDRVTGASTTESDFDGRFGLISGCRSARDEMRLAVIFKKLHAENISAANAEPLFFTNFKLCDAIYPKVIINFQSTMRTQHDS